MGFSAQNRTPDPSESTHHPEPTQHRRRSQPNDPYARSSPRLHAYSAKPGLDSTLRSSDSESMTDSQELELGNIHDGRLEDDEETGLTSDVRKQRSRRKRRNTQLGERLAASTPMADQIAVEEQLTRRTLYYRIALNTLFIGLWYTFSISISVYNKWMFSAEDGQHKSIFPFPLFTTCMHMVVQFALSSLILYCIPRFRPQSPQNDPQSHSAEEYPEKNALMTKWFYVTRIGPCGMATGLDIGLGNMSLKFISLTFYTMCKSSVLGFVLMFAFLFRLEKPSWRLFAIIVTMTFGVLMMVAGEAAFDVLGFILVMSAAASSGFRWSLTQILLLRNPATSNPFSSIFFLAPVMFVTLLIIALPVEGFFTVIEAFRAMATERGYLLSAGILLFPGCLAFAMTASEFALLQRTSVVTLSICGIFKEVLTISTASMVFHDEVLTPINFTGLIVTIATIAYYNYIKISRMKEEAKMEAQLVIEQDYAPVLASDPDEQWGGGGGGGGSSNGNNINNSIIASKEAGRMSTGDLIRNSLSINTSDRMAIKPKTISSPRVSPVKRPEDLD